LLVKGSKGNACFLFCFNICPAIITASLLGNTATAHIKKGSIFLGGDIGGTGQKTESNGITTNKQNGINISAVIGTAIKDNLIAGINAGFGFFQRNVTHQSQQA
jgi:hypothetical protein